MNAIKSCCPFCNQHVAHPVELEGQSVSCPTCGHTIKLGAIHAPNFEHAPSREHHLHPADGGNQARNWLTRRVFGE